MFPGEALAPVAEEEATERPRKSGWVVKHVRRPAPLHFPEEATVPESKRHLDLRTFLYQVLRGFADRHSIGCDQFVYWVANDTKKNVAPDAFVKLGTPDTAFGSWKTWERGAPDLCVEIVSEFDRRPASWTKKLARYHQLGAREVMLFDPHRPAGRRIRVWDRVDGDLVERVVSGDRTPCLTLGLHWVVTPIDGHPAGPRLARDPKGKDLVLTEAEAARAKTEAALAEAEAAKAEAKAAGRRIAELEAQLARRR